MKQTFGFGIRSGVDAAGGESLEGYDGILTSVGNGEMHIVLFLKS